MAGNIENKYGTNNQAITCTITSLANNGQRQSTAVDNTTNVFIDAMVFIKIKTAASGLATVPLVNVYAYGTADGGTTYTDGATGTDGSITLTSPPNMRIIGIVNTPSTSTTYEAGPFSVAAAFGGNIPDHWGIVVENKTGNTTDASVGSTWYQGIFQQYT